MRVLDYVPCSKGLPGCEGQAKGTRTFRVAEGKGWEVLQGFWDVTGASWADVDDDVSCLCPSRHVKT